MSDNNKLLSENTIRRFMKLANVGPISDNFLQENAEEEVNENEEEVTEEMAYAREDEEDPEAALDAEELPPEEEELEMDADLDLEEPAPESGAADISLTEEEAQLLIDLGERLSGAIGAGEDLGAEPEMAPEEPADDLGVEEPAADLAPEEEEEPMMQEALVKEVLKRVTKRIVSEKLKKNK